MIDFLRLFILLLAAGAPAVQGEIKTNVLYLSPVQPWTNQLAFQFLSLPGCTYTLEASTDLAHWSSLCYVKNIEASPRVAFLSDIYFTRYQRRFYRLAVSE